MNVKLPNDATTPTPTPTYKHQFEVAGRKIYFGAIKGKHMIVAQTQAGAKGGSVELGYRTLTAAILEAMGPEAVTYAELVDMDIKDVTPMLATIEN